MVPSMFNGMFGKLEPGLCRLTVNGGLAVKTSSGNYKTYNVKQQRLTNVTNFCFDVGEDFFFVIPTNKVSIGDIIIVEGKPKCVIEQKDSIITVLDYNSSEIRQLVPERHVFMGSAYFYGKIVSMFGDSLSLKGKNGMSRIMKAMMMKEIFSGSKTGDSGMGGLGQAIMMSALMGGNREGSDAFGDMFNFSLDDASDEDDACEDTEDDGE